MTSRAVLAMLFTACITGYTLGQQPEGQTGNYFPITVGSKWVYAVVDQKTELVVTASRNEAINGVACTVLDSSIDGKIVASEHVAVDGEQVLRFRLSNVDIVPPLPFSKPHFKGGEKWNSKFSITLEKKTVESEAAYIVQPAKVKVPAGEYDAFLVAGKIEKNNTAIWFARNIGAVKMQFDLGEGKRATLELKQVEIKK